MNSRYDRMPLVEVVGEESTYSMLRLEEGGEVEPTLEEEVCACIAMLQREENKFSYSLALSCIVYTSIVLGTIGAVVYAGMNLGVMDNSLQVIEDSWENEKCDHNYDPITNSYDHQFFGSHSLDAWSPKIKSTGVCAGLAPNYDGFNDGDPYLSRIIRQKLEVIKICSAIAMQYCDTLEKTASTSSNNVNIIGTTIFSCVLLSLAQLAYLDFNSRQRKKQKNDCIFKSLSADKLEQVTSLCEKAGIFLHRRSTIERVIKDLIEKKVSLVKERERLEYIHLRRIPFKQALNQVKNNKLDFSSVPPIYSFLDKDKSGHIRYRVLFFSNLLTALEEKQVKATMNTPVRMRTFAEMDKELLVEQIHHEVVKRVAI